MGILQADVNLEILLNFVVSDNYLIYREVKKHAVSVQNTFLPYKNAYTFFIRNLAQGLVLNVS